MMLKIESLAKVTVYLFVFTMMSMASMYGAGAAELDPVDYIKPIIGTNGTKRCGRTIPGPYMPFGMVQLSPDTRTGRGSTNGYNYRESTIEGFSVNHMSGVGWHGTLGNFQVMPAIGEMRFHSGSNEYDQYQSKDPGWKSKFSHEHEVAKAGYYSVLLQTYDILTELTCTQRTGMLRFTFPASDASRIQIDLARKIGGYSGRQHNVVVENGTIKGMIRCWGEGVGFAKGTRYNLYYYASFSRPWESYGLWNRGKDLGAQPDVENDDLGFYANYATKADEQISMKVGISYVSMAGAQANLEEELNHWDFDAVKKQARQTWQDEMTDVLSTNGGTEDQKTIFYTALYHTMMYPCDFTDVDGQYWGADKKVHGGKDYSTRMGFSGWDVYKHEFPLLTLIRPDVVNDQINTFLDICTLTGKTYPLWQMMGDYTGAGLGDPGLSVVVDAYMKGIRNFDIDRAYEISLQEATGPNSTRYYPDEMNSHGYVYSHRAINIALTLENTYGDWCISRFAQALGKTQDAKAYRQRAGENYKKLFDKSAGWMRQKDAAGKWKTPWTDKFARDGCKEGNTYQWTWFVPHDVQGLIDLMGESRFLSELDAFFAGAPADFSPGNTFYNHSNEPVHQIISYFNFAGQPWRTQYWTRTVLDGAYGTDHEGLAHNDDFGQLSAWYVLNAMGFNPVAPGENVWHIGSPVFNEIEIKLDPQYHLRTQNKTFTIIAQNNSVKNIYIQSATLNGQPLDRPWITHAELISGGTLRLKMGPSKSQWGREKNDRPPSVSRGAFPGAIKRAQEVERRPNVLLIGVDDLNDWIGCLGGHPQARTPHMDRLAARGVLFSNAHCQSPVCNPSRASLMTSLYPSSSGIYFLNPDLSASPVARKNTLMPQRFQAEGYFVTGAGKLFHGAQNQRYLPNYGGSFGAFGPRPKKKISPYPGHPLWDWGAFPERDEQMPDHQIATWAEKRLAESREAPLWMGVGFYRPHVPQFAPQTWFDLYPMDTLQLPKTLADDLKDISQYGIDITRLKHVAPTHEWVLQNDQWKALVQSYLACVSFVDAQVGRVLDALDQSIYRDNTYIVLFSDHGFHQGEKERYAKRSLWKDGAAVPMIMAGPGIVRGKTCDRPVQLLDIYPTLLELTRLKADPRHEGHSLVPLLKDPNAKWPHLARSSFGPGNYAIISKRYRFIQYNDGTEELYDHSKDPHEWHNVVDDPRYASVVKRHKRQVPQERYEILGKGSTGHLSYTASEQNRSDHTK